MNIFKILERCRENASIWELCARSDVFSSSERKTYNRVAKEWRTLEADILKSIDEESMGLEEQANFAASNSGEQREEK